MPSSCFHVYWIKLLLIQNPQREIVFYIIYCKEKPERTSKWHPHVPSSSWMTSMFLRKICHNCLQLLPQLLLPQLHIRLFHNTEVCDLKPPYSFLRTSVFASFLLLAQDHRCLPQPSSIGWPLPPPDFILRLSRPQVHHYIICYSHNLLGHSSFSYACMANLQTRGRTLTTQLLYSFTVSI